jgi:hypothetical protein
MECACASARSATRSRDGDLTPGRELAGARPAPRLLGLFGLQFLDGYRELVDPLLDVLGEKVELLMFVHAVLPELVNGQLFFFGGAALATFEIAALIFEIFS